MLRITKEDRRPYYEYYVSLDNERARVVRWARNILEGRCSLERALAQLGQLVSAVEAAREGRWVVKPRLSPEGVALTILFALGEPLRGEEVDVEGFSRGDIQVFAKERKIIVHVKEREFWVYRFSPPASDPSAPSATEASVGARARIKRAR